MKSSDKKHITYKIAVASRLWFNIQLNPTKQTKFAGTHLDKPISNSNPLFTIPDYGTSHDALATLEEKFTLGQYQIYSNRLYDEAVKLAKTGSAWRWLCMPVENKANAVLDTLNADVL